ncbi:MAG: heavy-metal-associated domain-containing protein [Bacteroidota bacterium]
MKRIILVIVTLILAFQMQAQFTKGTLRATGLTCAMCSNAINKALQKIPFVESVKSDIKNSAFNIVFRQNANVDIDALKNAVEDAGFSVGNLKLTGTFSKIAIANEHPVQIGEQQFCFLNANNQTLNGEATLTVVDKNFMTAKEFKKISSSSKMTCLQTGKRIFHVTI